MIYKSKRKVVEPQFFLQSNYVFFCLDRFGQSDCKGVDLPLHKRLSPLSQPFTLLPDDYTVYHAMVVSLLYVAQWILISVAQSLSYLVLFQERFIWIRHNGFQVFVTLLTLCNCIWNILLQLFQVLLFRITSCGGMLILIELVVQTLDNILLAVF